MARERVNSSQKDDSDIARHQAGEPPEKKGSSEKRQHAPPGPGPDAPAEAPPTHPKILRLQRTIGNRAVARLLQRKVSLSDPHDASEREADSVAKQVMTAREVAPQPARPGSKQAGGGIQKRSLASSITPLQREAAPDAAQGEHAQADDGSFEAAQNIEGRLGSGGSPLPDAVRGFMESQFGEDFSQVRAHTGGEAAQMSVDLNAEAFTYDRNIYYGPGRAPANDALTAHELTHVVQQTGAGDGHLGRKLIQRNLSGSFPVTNGGFEVDMRTQEGAVNTPPTHSGMNGTIRFIPLPTAPNSNSIVLIQIIKVTDLTGADRNIVTMPATRGPRGALGSPGVRTQDDPARGVEGGFHTDVLHQTRGGPAAPFHSPLSLRYPFRPGSRAAQVPGFKRSSDPSDIRSAVLGDAPGTSSAAVNVDFKFETVARGEDTMITYGSVRWGFGLRAGRVVNETISVVDAASATFEEALERHRDFYVHEEVSFYFDFDSSSLSATEAAKIDTFLPYLTRNPTAQMSLQGFADIRGGSGAYNQNLARRRARAVRKAMLGRGIDPGRIVSVAVGEPGGASTSATPDAGTADQPGANPAVGADQDREANRQFNRRVVVTFKHSGGAPAPAPAPGGGP